MPSRRHSKRKFLLVLILMTTALVISAARIYSHPHVFIDTRVEISFDQKGLAGFWIVWSFDEMFTAGILMDFDRDRNRVLSAGEVAEIEKDAFSNLAHYRYFTYIRSAKGLHRPERVRDFTAYLEKDHLHYRFFVPYPLAVGAGEVEVTIAVYDETFFCSIDYFDPSPLVLPAGRGFRGTYEIREDKAVRIEYPSLDGRTAYVFPRAIVLRLRRSP